MGREVGDGWEFGLLQGKVGAEPSGLGVGASSMQGLPGQLGPGALRGASGSSQGAWASDQKG